MKILAIETSCDETAASVVEGKGNKLKVLSNVVSSQIEIHKKYGGVVPEVAARHHVLNIIPVIKEALAKANITLPLLDKERVGVRSVGKKNPIDAIAVTAGPGLITSLIVGAETAKALAFAWQKPLVAVNHIAGHIYANWLPSQNQASTIKFPAVVLTVSGGHNLLVLMKKHLDLKTIGDTRDDAAGEAFDKGAKLLGLGYPGGPAIAANAALIKNEELKIKNLGVASQQSIKFPRPMINDNNFDFSFSGLKTSLLYALPKDKNWQKRIADYAHEYQQAIIDVLIKKTIKAALHYKVKTVLLAGGVSANKELRQQLAEAVAKNCPQVAFHCPDLAYTTDNATMIGSAGYFKFKAGQTISPDKIKINPNWQL